MTLSHDQARQTEQGSGTLSQAVPHPSRRHDGRAARNTISRSQQRARPDGAVLYPFPQPNVGLMQPADAQRDVWVEEMFANRLTRLDSRTRAVTSWLEQGVNYIGHFDPLRQTFRIFPLGSVQGRLRGP